jgi:hypothetical protein
MCSFESRQTHRGDGVLPGGRGEYIVALDADVIPEAHWLRSVTAYLVDNVCLSTTIVLQHFRGRYNTVELDVFVHAMVPT